VSRSSDERSPIQAPLFLYMDDRDRDSTNEDFVTIEPELP
jgi:hypothetical protein